MKKYIAIFVLSLPLLLSSCDSPKAKEEALAKQVLELHDEVMPKMQDMMRLRKELKKQKSTLDSTSLENATIDTLILNLENADKGMMDWMHNYNGGQNLYTHEEVMNYLEAEKEKMAKVKIDTDKSMEAATKYLNK